MELNKKVKIITTTEIAIAVITFMSFGITMVSGNHKITDIIATVGVIEILFFWVVVIFRSIWKEHNRSTWHIGMVLSLLAIAGISYFMYMTGDYGK